MKVTSIVGEIKTIMSTQDNTMIVIPTSHYLLSGWIMVPTMDDPMGAHWTQPDRNLIHFEIAGHHWDGATSALRVYMHQLDMNMLREYSTNLPSGVYPGKMWKAQWDGAWHLRWYGAEKDGECPVHTCPIMLLEALALINPPGD